MRAFCLGASRQVQRALQDDEREDGERQRDEEVPAPAERVGDDAAEERSADGGDGHDGAEQAHVAAALARADDVGHDDLAEGGEAAGADALHGAERDERVGVLREAGGGRREHEDRDRDLDEQLAVEQVGELAPDGGGDRRRQQRRGDDPREGGLVALEVVDDDGQRGRDDGRREHRHEHAEQEAREGREHFARGARSTLDRARARWRRQQTCGSFGSDCGEDARRRWREDG